MEIIEIEREFNIELPQTKLTLPDPNELMTPPEVLEFYSNQYPELTSANWSGPKIINDKKVYTFSAVLGNKG